MQKLKCALAAILMMCGCAGREPGQTSPVRQRFVPADAEASNRRPASWSALVPAPDRPGALWLRAHVRIGGTFPVREENGPTLFDVIVTDGNDDHLVLAIQSLNCSQTIDVPRDKPTAIHIAGHQYEFLYPSVHVDPSVGTTTEQAFLILTRYP